MMRTTLLAAACIAGLVLLVSSAHAGEWVDLDPENTSSVTKTPTDMSPYEYSSISASVTTGARYVSCFVSMHSRAYDEDEDDVELYAQAIGTVKDEWEYQVCGEKAQQAPATSFAVHGSRILLWENNGDADNWRFWSPHGRAKAHGNLSIQITTSPDHNGDVQTEAICEGDVAEDSSWVAQLKRKWESEWDTLTWDDTATNDDDWADSHPQDTKSWDKSFTNNGTWAAVFGLCTVTFTGQADTYGSSSLWRIAWQRFLA